MRSWCQWMRRAAPAWLFVAQFGNCAASEQALAAVSRAPVVPDEILVQFRAGVEPATKSRVRRQWRVSYVETVVSEARREDGSGELQLLRIAPGTSLSNAVRMLERDPSVEYAEPNWIYFHQATSNDPYYTNSLLWGLYGDASRPANAFGSQAAEAWAAGRVGADTVYVGLIDEGVMHTHVDLRANIWVNPYDPVDGIDNDGNGYVDDTRGWDFANNDNSTYDGTTDDHGTHVAGTIGAVGGNAIGVAGVSWKVKLISAKFLGSSGGTTANAIKAMDYLTALKIQRGVRIVAVNASWGGAGFSQALQDAIERANAANILFVAAAGNSASNIDAAPYYPASYPNANLLAVAAIDSRGRFASFSNYGLTTVDLGAPGVGILSTFPGVNGASSYATMDGTSMAAPHVTGAAALYAASRAAATVVELRSAILSSVVPTVSLSAKCVSGGRLNASQF
ncbi:MAG: S8 family peptidase [Methylotetracoccus sp.]